MRKLMTMIGLSVLPFALSQVPVGSEAFPWASLPTIDVESAVTSVLGPGSAVNFKDGSYVDIYVLHGDEGERVLLTAASSEIDSYLSLISDTGELLVSNDDGPGMMGTDASLEFSLPYTGRYLVGVSSYWSSDEGRYTLTRSTRVISNTYAELAVPGRVIGSSGDSNVTLDPVHGTTALGYSFELEKPTILTATVTSPYFDTYLILTDGEGNLVAENDDEDFSSTTGWSTDSKLFVELEPGEYYLYVTSLYGTAEGAFTLETRTFVAAD